MLSAGLIYIRLEHYVMGAEPSPQAKVIEAVDHFLAFFLSLLAAKDASEPEIVKPAKAAAKQKTTKKERRG